MSSSDGDTVTLLSTSQDISCHNRDEATHFMHAVDVCKPQIFHEGLRILNFKELKGRG